MRSAACICLAFIVSSRCFYPPQSPLGKGGSLVLPLTKGELEGVSRGSLNKYAALPRFSSKIPGFISYVIRRKRGRLQDPQTLCALCASVVKNPR